MANKSLWMTVLDWVISLVIIIVFAFGIRYFVMEPRKVMMSSMYPTLVQDDLILVDKLAYLTAKPERGDIIVFTPENGGDDLVKRIIGLPGEWIEYRDGFVYVNGQKFEEQDIHPDTNYRQTFKPAKADIQGARKLSDNEYYVMGDNRPSSLDSRTFGPIKLDQFVGKAFFTFWPPKSIHVLR
jgi:signal peptidase I